MSELNIQSHTAEIGTMFQEFFKEKDETKFFSTVGKSNLWQAFLYNAQYLQALSWIPCRKLTFNKDREVE